VIDVTNFLDFNLEQKLILSFDQVVAASLIYRDRIEVRFAGEDYTCAVVDLNQPKIV